MDLKPSLCLAFLCIALVKAADPLLVNTNKGPVKGVTLTSEAGKPVDAFLGIPYAKPPVGKNRFKHPQPIDPWTKVFDATKKPNTCVHVIDVMKPFPEYKLMAPNTPLSEDCLMLNVWVPNPRPQKAAVMVWIYGGGFFSGSSSLDIYDMKVLASEQNVIAVSLNYRVASLGFLYLGHPDAPGNSGLYDQVLALQWVKNNIAAFGGDPEKITIFGESAGGASVSFHLLSPLSQNLFNRAIAQSGSANALWALQDHATALQNGLNLAKRVNCPNDPNKLDEVVQCLLTKDPKELTTLETTSIIMLPFAPVIDENMVVEHPVQSLKNHKFKKAELMIGTTREEGSLFLSWNSDIFSVHDEVYLSRSQFLEIVELVDPIKSEVSNESITFEYTNWEDPDDQKKNTDAIEKIAGDTFITCASVNFARSYAEAGNSVYQYELRRRFSLNDRAEWMGVVHSEDLAFVLGKSLNKDHKFPPEEIKFTQRVMSYWANFAKTGNPNISPSGQKESITWPVYSVKGKEFLPLKDNSDKAEHGLRARRCAFWTEHLPRMLELAGE